MMPDDVIVRVRRAIRHQPLFSSGARLVVAVSGGPDSVVLLHVLHRLRAEWKLTLRAAHLDHGLRDDSPRDAAFVEELASRWRVPVTIERREVAVLCRRRGWSLEDGARRLRYQFLVDVAQRHSASHVALAHTADDQAETVLMRLVRGTGLLGLGAMPAMRRIGEVWIVRPLLEVWRAEILAYLAEHQLSACQDATNDDQRFVRNRIRHELLPLLVRHYNPNIKDALTQLAEQSRWDYAYLQAAADRQWKRTAGVEAPAHVTLRVAVFRRQPKAIQRQLVRQVIQRIRAEEGRWEFRHWIEVERLFSERPIGTVLDLPGGVQAMREEERVVFRRQAPTPNAPRVLK
ncbi:MAG: tRNA lysidine(34) synthetase TilS [Candidatus Omnitrophica bacterium]|nr:tRNA lysidine(34) synthetase TilS [Candidatus Omnitrophota bacterium]